ncbi:MAG: BMP family ABC transporter substrate-binding protein [Cyanobacteriota bacterium]|nr:BMP family ABC transporter substrate-binding protein [Cyanobacteriota bacterium]
MSQRPFLKLTRRQWIQSAAAATTLTLTSQVWKFNTAQAQDKLVIGFIYVGPKDDFGYNQAHFEGKEGISKLEGVETVDEANVPETTAVEESMRAMIEQDGATVLFPTSFGYFDPHILKLAEEYPEVQFFHCGGLYQEGTHPKNVGSYYGYIDEAQYIAGIVAASTSKTGKLGFIGAKPIPQVVRNINSFTLGAQSVKPDITTQLIFTGDWALPVKEAEAANSMADQGIDVITCHVDSPKIVMETAEKRGIFCSGYHADQVKLAPKGYLTGAEWDWTSVYTNYTKEIQAGKTLMNGGIPHLVRGGLKDGFCKLSAYGPAVGEEGKKAADAAKAKFMDDTMIIYKGELKDNTGKVVIPAGTELPQKAPELESMGWLVAGVLGSTQS